MGRSDDAFIAALAIVMVFGMPIAFLMMHRVFSHRERMELIRRGVTPPPDPLSAKKMARMQRFEDYDPDRVLRKGITVAMIGAAIFIGMFFIGFGPWLIAGLIVLFIGIAQIIIAVMSGARFGAWETRSEQQPSSFTQSREVPPGPYGWRPGRTVELEKPAQPPDLK